MSDKKLHGFYEDMPNESYHKSEGVSKSGLDLIDRSPAHYKWPKKRTSTRNMEVGTAIHAAILEPERFDKEYVISEGDKRNTKEYKELVKVNPLGSEFTLSKPEADNVLGMRESVHGNVEAMQFLSATGKAELSAFATDPETGIILRARYDWITDSGIVVDVKKTQDLRKFGRSVSDYRYHVQEAVYRHVYKLITGDDLQAFYFLAVEEESPHSNKMFLLDDLSLEIGEHYFRQNLRRYAECKNSGVWPHAELDSFIGVPNWEVNKYEESLEVFV